MRVYIVLMDGWVGVCRPCVCVCVCVFFFFLLAAPRSG